MKSNEIKNLLILLGITLITNSCCNHKLDKNKDNLIGSWTLDSVSHPNNQFYKYPNTKILEFVDKTDYTFEWWSDDVGNKSSGKYFILNNPKRGLKTITCIPNLQTIDKKSIRLECINLDIISLKGNRLIMIGETKWIDRKDLPSLKFNEISIYKRRNK